MVGICEKIILVQITNLSSKPNVTFYISLFLKHEKTPVLFYIDAHFAMVTIEF